MEQIDAALGLAYLSGKDFAGLQDCVKKRMLGAIAFGENDYAPDHLSVSVNMPALSEPTLIEVWLSNQPVMREKTADISISCNDELLFGCIRVCDNGFLNAASRRCYQTLHANGSIDDQRAPAACALGSRGDALVIYFLAAKKSGLPIENPRQISAYHYPSQHGPRSPLFSRGMVALTGGGPLLFISGTASIVGHETLHAGNAMMQSRQTVSNLRTIIEQAQSACPDLDWSRNTLLLKAYVRHCADQPLIRQCLIEAFGEDVSVIYLQADICRRDLLVEVEGTYFDRSHTNLH